MQLVFKIVLLGALVAAPALSSAIKGHLARDEHTKGQKGPLSPLEQHRESTKGRLSEQKIEQHFEQREAQQQLISTEQKLDKEEPLQQQQQRVEELGLKGPQEESPKQRYEAKPQLSRDDLAKGQQRLEDQKLEESKTRVELQKTEERFEQQQQLKQEQYELPQLELKEEQRRFEETPLVQPILPLTVVEEAPRQLPVAGVKGAAPVLVPLAEAEPYAFSYSVDGSTRTESGDTKGVVRGQYTLQNADGSSRVVDYVADHNGFRASINTNEFGTEAKSPAGIALRSSQPSAEDITLKLEGKTREDLLPPAVKAPPPVPAKPENWAVKAPELPKAIVETPGKGQRLVQLEELPIKQEAQLETTEQRAPKALAGELKIGQLRSGFESATAHRVHQRGPVVVRPVGPPLRALAPPPLPLVRQPPVVTVSRTQLQRERYPPSPVTHRRVVQPDQLGNPRVSFYGSNIGGGEEGGFEYGDLLS